MEIVVLTARVALVLIFLGSALAKLRDPQGARQAITDFGVPASLAPTVALLLAPVELASAALLLTLGLGVVAGALLAAGLLAAFTVGIVVNLWRGNLVDCHCFGALSTKPLSWWSVARNATLIVLALVVLAGGTDQGFVWTEVADIFRSLSTTEAWLTVAVLLLAVAVVGLATLFFQLLQRYGSVLLRLEALESGAGGHHHGHAVDFQMWPAPDIEAVDPTGASVGLSDLLDDDRASLFVFVSPGCVGCAELIDDLNAWQGDRTGPPVVVFSPGDRATITDKFAGVAIHSHDGPVVDDYRMEYTPGAVVVTADGLVTTPPSYGSDDVRRLYNTLAGRAPSDIEIGPPPVREGDPAPEVEVELAGVAMPIAQAAGDDAVLLFWDTTCGFCQQITEDVRRRQDSVPLLLVLRGSDVDNVRVSGLTSPIAVDPEFAVGNALQAPGTPVAVRLREGRIASTVAVGGPEVLDLLAAVRVIG